MKILVTGGAGFIGSHTVVELLNAGHEVVVVDNLCNSSKKSLQRVKKITGKEAAFYKLDIRDEKKLCAVLDREGPIGAAIHFAALKAVGESTKIPLKYYNNNLGGTFTLLKCLGEHGCKNIVFSSSATVYGQPRTVPIREDFPTPGCTNPYGWTKLMMEQVFRDVQQADPTWNVILLRYFNPIGAHPSGLIGEDPAGIPNNLLPYVAQVAIGRRPELNVWGDDYPTPDGTGVRDYIHVVDLAIGHLKAIEKLEKEPKLGLKIYNLGTGNGYSVLQVVKAFERASKRPVPFKICPRRPGDIAECWADPSLAAQELGWKAERGIDEMCADAWRWQRKNPYGFGKPPAKGGGAVRLLGWSLAVCLAACGSAFAAEASADELDACARMPEPVSFDLGKLEWKLPKDATRDGDWLTVDVPTPRVAMASADVDLSGREGHVLLFSMRTRCVGIVQPKVPYHGFKFQLCVEYADGTRQWPAAGGGSGDWDEMRTVKVMLRDVPVARARLELGIQSSVGKAKFDLSTLRAADAGVVFRKVNCGYRAEYTDDVKARTRFRGVMLPMHAEEIDEDCFVTLEGWGANLARFQIAKGWNRTDAWLDLREYDAYVNGELDQLERRILPLAAKHGVKICIDLHAAPGARVGDQKELRMCYEKKYADHFVETWRRIARRFRCDARIYGFDLVNEPVQKSAAPYSYLHLQLAAARAIREIDPVTPVIVESNGYDSPLDFAYLSPIRLTNVIYQAHCYLPMELTHQGVKGRPKTGLLGYPNPEKGWNREFLRKALANVRAFERQHGAKIYIGEFSAATWVPGAEHYLRDAISIFEEYGWDWSYHAFREAKMWSVEHTWSLDEKGRGVFTPSDDNPRLGVLKAAFRDRLPVVVADAKGYNSWPMIATVGDRLVCTYSRGSGHTIGEGRRDAYARVSTDGGRTWGEETVLAASPDEGEVMIGKGNDADGAALFWVRCLGKSRHHDLYRTTDGRSFAKVSTPVLSPFPMQITDVFAVRKGLMCLWFQTDYKKNGKSSWGTLLSTDNGATWTQKTVAANVPLAELPTEPSVVPLGGGRLLGIARSEIVDGGRQFQLTSTDDGETWQMARTNIADVRSSSPSLVYEPSTGLVFNYYYERGKAKLKRRTAKADDVFANPTRWPEPEVVATGDEERPHDAGNVNVTVQGGKHRAAYYSGSKTQTAVYVVTP